MLMDEYLDELKATWNFNPHQLAHIKSLMVNYACATNMDSAIRQEMTDLANEEAVKEKEFEMAALVAEEVKEGESRFDVCN